MNRNDIYGRINDTIIAERLFLYRKNLFKNLPLIKEYGGLKRVLPLLDNKTVIVAGAGPSMDEYYEILKEHCRRQDVVIIAADMSYRQLLQNGVIPDFVITCETVPVDFFVVDDLETAGNSAKVSLLLAFSCSSNSNLRKWDGDICFFNWMKNGPGFDELWQDAGIDLGFVGTASIVTTQAISIALGCRIKQLVVLGNDMAFYDRYYGRYSDRYRKLFSGSSRMHPAVSTERNLIEKNKYYEIIRNDRKYYTNHQFVAAKQWLEELFYRTDKTIYDGSVPGCSPDTVKKITISDLRRILSLKRNRNKRG